MAEGTEKVKEGVSVGANRLLFSARAFAKSAPPKAPTTPPKPTIPSEPSPTAIPKVETAPTGTEAAKFPPAEASTFDDLVDQMEGTTGSALGWLSRSLAGLGIRRPTAVQRATLPPAFQGRDIVGCAPTGQGKTLCFVIPILASLAANPGLAAAFSALILTPSRELAIQTKETVMAVAREALPSVRVCVLLGGLPLGEQTKLLASKPHLLIATPGRLAQIIRIHSGEDTEGARNVATVWDATALRRTRFLVLDEADRLLSTEFGPDIGTILSALPPPRSSVATEASRAPLVPGQARPGPSGRQTLLFAATMTRNMTKLAAVSARAGVSTQGSAPEGSTAPFVFFEDFDSDAPADAMPVDETEQNGDDEVGGSGSSNGAQYKVNPLIRQEYLFMPPNVKHCYLVYILRSFLGLVASHIKNDAKGTGKPGQGPRPKNRRGGGGGPLGPGQPSASPAGQGQAIVFVRSCVLCEEISTMLSELGIATGRLHSWMKQSDRSAALAHFRSGLTKVLVATDLAHRGLDIQRCKLVVQYNLPEGTKAYVHRIGRTGRTHQVLPDPQPNDKAPRFCPTGHSIVLVDPREVDLLLAIEADLATKVGLFPAPEGQILAHLNDSIAALELAKLVRHLWIGIRWDQS